MSASPYTWPFNLFAPGNLNQPILPGWSFAGVNVNYAGNAGIEREVIEKVASFGKQIGIISDVVLELAKAMPDGVTRTDAGTKKTPISQLRDIAKEVEKLKKEHMSSLLSEAREAMDRLARARPESARYVAEKYTGEPPAPAAPPARRPKGPSSS